MENYINELSKWTFPEEIKMEQVHEYKLKFNYLLKSEKLRFDLSKTKSIHSSFIGLLIHIKEHFQKYEGSFELILSHEVEKIFKMLEISDYFSNIIVKIPARKTA